MATAFGFGTQQQQNPWGLSPYGGQTIGIPGQGIGIGQPYTQPLQQIFQSLQSVPLQLHQLQHQLLQLQQVLQVVPVQLQQLQQLVQFIPQQIQQLQQQQPFGLGVTAGLPFQSMSTINPFAGQSAPVM
jgi:hypothetical protein